MYGMLFLNFFALLFIFQCLMPVAQAETVYNEASDEMIGAAS